jgi:NADPH2:quinone reductase
VMQGGLKAGEWLLVNGVSSGVGVSSLQMGKALGAKVIGTSGSNEKLAALKPLGLDVALCTRQPDFAQAVMEATGQKGANLVVNTVGGTVFAEDLRCMAFEGRHAMVGYVDGQLHADIDLEALHAKRLVLFGVSNKLRTKDQRASSVPGFVADVLPHIAAGRIQPQIDQVVDFAQLPQAKARMEAGAHVGKIILRVAA